MGLMAATLFLVLITLFNGFLIDESPLFIIAECIINLLIIIDFVCRVRLVGLNRFIKGGCWNIFDTIVVIACVILFAIILISKTGGIKSLEEVSEEVLLIMWSVF
jgi:uncharacterized membrane protein